jgi:NhaP-type Na+/H+ or K+/H+ antiporter
MQVQRTAPTVLTCLVPGGGLIGIGYGIATRFTLRFLQRFGATAEQQIALTLACGYLSFYTANSPAKVSGGNPQIVT